jgi:mono/diheme cytochrome c family protein
LRHATVLLAFALAASGCDPSLPEPESAGAHIFQARCSVCHRLYAPESMTAAMWDMQLERMRLLFDASRIPWLPPEEEATLVAYLHAHAGGQ